MAIQSFDEARHTDCTEVMLVINRDKIETYHGYYAAIRIDRKTVPEGWYVYDIRHSDDDGAEVAELKNGYIWVNHFGTFMTQTKLPLGVDESINNLIDEKPIFTISWD